MSRNKNSNSKLTKEPINKEEAKAIMEDALKAVLTDQGSIPHKGDQAIKL